MLIHLEHKQHVAVTQLKTVPLFYRRKPSVSLCVLVVNHSLSLTILHHGGTKIQRDTKNFVENVVQQSRDACARPIFLSSHT